PPDDLVQKALGLLLEREDVGANLLQRPQRLRLVEVPGETDLVPNLDAVRYVPGVRSIWQDLTAQKGIDPTLLEERYLLGVAQVGVGLVLDDSGLAADPGLEESAQRIGRRALLVDLPDHRRRVVGALGALLQRLDLLRGVGALGVDALEPQRALDGDLPVAEGFVREDLRLLGLLEFEEGVTDALDVLGGELAVLLAEVLAQRLVPARRIDELDLAFAVLRLAVREHPDVGRDAGVVEHVEWQGDDRFQPVVLDDPAANVALALAGVAGEQRAAVVHLGDAASEFRVFLHLREHVGQKHHLAIARAGDK